MQDRLGLLGDRSTWPAGLASGVDTVLGAAVPMALVVGEDAVLVYNDAYASILGTKHPDAFGRPAAEVFPENWHLPGHWDLVWQVMKTGEGVHDPDTVLPVRRRGPDAPAELVRFSRSYAALRGEDGRVLGVLSVVIEITGSARTLRQVADLAARLSSALSVDDVAREVLRYAVEDVGAHHARVVLLEGGALRMTRRAALDVQDESTERLPLLWTRLRADAALPSVQVAREGAPLWLGADALEHYNSLQDERLGRPLRAVGSVPLPILGQYGALSLGWEDERDFSTEDMAALRTVGSLVGQALGRAQRFDEQRGNAELLQRSMLPAEMPQVAGVSIGARYVPSAPGMSAGGDFYDAFTSSDGRLVLAIGDVVGHGVMAATIMGQVRAGLRVLGLQEPDPAAVLGALDPFVSSLGPEVFVTALVAVLDPLTGLLQVATAGHPPPLLRRLSGPPGGTFVELEAGPPVGVPGERPVTTEVLASGDLLLLFTDGLVEVPGQHLDTGLERLQDTVASLHGASDPRQACTVVLERMGSGSDDIAVVAVSVDEGSRRVARLDLPAETSAAGTARAWARRMLGGWGVDDDRLDAALLCTSELVTNAFLHARSGCLVELDVDDHRVLVLVSDQGMTTLPAAQAAEPGSVRGRGLALVETLSDAWGSERTSRGTTVWFEIGLD
ncbi:serine phosphatase RsbU (regulator of sigma subunit) [Motilibacter peucedani]|uniref:Serine phosphatase RsbU (Regulator of sigma subunit) n=1 Tax=Motilibacter peucedani TaxID=598650 RepID=A0A420XN56_9ACTN|nr:SpoIIE family protein phosphatase [Motilibacter peucedani]RKS72706.1 serine phosphatase RsbU (regulator of sigma subunit) [Motilibacter peucedani]